MTELQAGRPHPLEGDRAGQFGFNLVHSPRLVFEPAHEAVPQLEDGGGDRSLSCLGNGDAIANPGNGSMIPLLS